MVDSGDGMGPVSKGEGREESDLQAGEEVTQGGDALPGAGDLGSDTGGGWPGRAGNRVWGRRGMVAAALVIAGAVGAAIVVTGGFIRPSGARPAAATAPDPDPATAPQYAGFYGQTLGWSSCYPALTGPLAVQCAHVSVPVDWAHPEGQKISLSVVRHRASGRRIGSLLLNPGGPGTSGIDFASDAVQVFGKDVLASYDVVGWDPRGVGESSPVQCPADPPSAALIDDSPDTPAELAASEQRWRERGQACLAHTDPDLLRHVDTLSTVRDLDLLRAVLGDAKLFYYGASYGTRIGTLYAQAFPARIARMVLDSPYDPALDRRSIIEGSARGAERSLDSYLTSCPTRAGCPFQGSSLAQARTRISDLLQRIETHPLSARPNPALAKYHLQTMISGVELQGMIKDHLYWAGAWPILDTIFAAALHGNGDAVLKANGNPNGFTPNGATAWNAIYCLDVPDHRTPQQQLADAIDVGRRYPVLGNLLAWDLSSCSQWPVSPVLTPQRITATVTTPILIVATTKDPATPYEWAQSLATQLPSATLLTRDGDGHGSYHHADSPCIDTAVDTYLLHATTPPPHTTCPAPPVGSGR